LRWVLLLLLLVGPEDGETESAVVVVVGSMAGDLGVSEAASFLSLTVEIVFVDSVFSSPSSFVVSDLGIGVSLLESAGVSEGESTSMLDSIAESSLFISVAGSRIAVSTVSPVSLPPSMSASSFTVSALEAFSITVPSTELSF